MDATVKPLVTIAVITHNGRLIVEECIQALLSQSYPIPGLMVIDVASEDETASLIAGEFPGINVVEMPVNTGPNPARNLALERAQTPYVLLVDDDAVLEPGCLLALVSAAGQYPDGGVWAPRLVYYGRPDVIQHQGGQYHFVGEAMLRDAGRTVSDATDQISEITIASGACMLVKREAWAAVGKFDEDYFFGRTDSEFTHRLVLAGIRNYLVPAAVCRHKVKDRSFKMIYYQIRNRWYFTLSAYSIRTLLVLAPALIVHELLLAIFLLFNGRIATHMRALADVIKNRRLVMRKRSATQALRRVPDRCLLASGSILVRSDLIKLSIGSVVKRAAELLYRGYWGLARPLLDRRVPQHPTRCQGLEPTNMSSD